MPTQLGRVLITGATGRLGQALFEHFTKLGAQVMGTFGKRPYPGFERIDLASQASILTVLERANPDVILHAGAMTDVDACERDEASAMCVNARASEVVARYAQRRGARYVYVSTDYVFDGESGPYDESSPPRPISIYGRSKLLGEQAALDCADGVVARVGILYGSATSSSELTLVSQIVDDALRGKTTRLDGRRLKYPTLTDDVARALETVLIEQKTGIFHVCNPIGMSRYEWGLAIAAAFDLDPGGIVRDDAVELGKPAQRPFDVKLRDTRLGFVHTRLSAALLQIRRRRTEEQAA